MTVQILGENYEILYKDEREDERLKDRYAFCDWTTKQIVLDKDMSGSLGNVDEFKKKVLRHEIVHVFLLESGLGECAGESQTWASNEEMVDWFARKGPKIYKAWKEATCV